MANKVITVSNFKNDIVINTKLNQYIKLFIMGMKFKPLSEENKNFQITIVMALFYIRGFPYKRKILKEC